MTPAVDGPRVNLDLCVVKVYVTELAFTSNQLLRMSGDLLLGR